VADGQGNYQRKGCIILDNMEEIRRWKELKEKSELRKVLLV